MAAMYPLCNRWVIVLRRGGRGRAAGTVRADSTPRTAPELAICSKSGAAVWPLSRAGQLHEVRRRRWSTAPPENRQAPRPPAARSLPARWTWPVNRFCQRRPTATRRQHQLRVFPNGRPQRRRRGRRVLPSGRQLGQPARHNDNRHRPVAAAWPRAAARTRRRVWPARPALPTEYSRRSEKARRAGGETEAFAR